MTADEYREQIAMMSKSMFRYCLSRTNSYHDAEDLAQEILLISCKGENSFPNEKAFYAFVWSTADKILKGWYRGRERRETAELDETISDGSWEQLEEQTKENEQLRLITRELSHLNSNYRRVTVAYYIEGMSVKDISQRYGLTQSMVKYLLFQSRKRIREGIDMDKNFGRLSYQPAAFDLFFWGGRNNYWGKFDTKVRQNIMMACYYDKQNEEQISLQLGVPTAYLEDDIKALAEHDLLTEKGGFYLTNVPLITHEVFDEIERENKQELNKMTERIKTEIDGMLDKVRAIGFYGNDMPNNTLKWQLLSLILRMAYLIRPQDRCKLDFPTDIFGEKCFRFFVEPYGSYAIGISGAVSGNKTILFWDVAVNGRMLHPEMTETRADMALTLLERQPQTENEKLVCAELIRHGFAVNDDGKIKLNFPYFTAEQSEKLMEMLDDLCNDICQNVLDRTDIIRKTLREHTPAHLTDYTDRIAILLHYKEVERIIQNLCESGWLLPCRSGMLGTTMIYTDKE